MTQPTKVAILGSTGMLGQTVHRYLASRPDYHLGLIDRASGIDAATVTAADLARLLAGHQYAINCIGIIKPRIDEQSSPSVLRAMRVNAVFPHILAEAAEAAGCRVLQIATDCVYSGQTWAGFVAGGYTESSPKDPLDVYGWTKSLGEVRSPAVRLLRCSIIGPEGQGRPRDSLLEWFLGQPAGSMLKGFTNHRWNGVTTLAFARLCDGVMRGGAGREFFDSLPACQHVVPADEVTKAELLCHFARVYARDDVSVGGTAAVTSIDRTLSTRFSTTNQQLWKSAGYFTAPTIWEMVEEMAGWSAGRVAQAGEVRQ